MRPFLALLMMLSLALAGCSDDSPASDPEDPGKPFDPTGTGSPDDGSDPDVEGGPGEGQNGSVLRFEETFSWETIQWMGGPASGSANDNCVIFDAPAGTTLLVVDVLLEWTPQSEAARTLQLALETGDAREVVAGEGPLNATWTNIPALQQGVLFTVSPSEMGLLANQPLSLTIIMEYGGTDQMLTGAVGAC